MGQRTKGGKVLTPIELEGFATSKAQGDETTLARGLRLELFGIFPLSGKGTHSVIRPGKAQSDQIPVHAAQVAMVVNAKSPGF